MNNAYDKNDFDLSNFAKQCDAAFPPFSPSFDLSPITTAVRVLEKGPCDCTIGFVAVGRKALEIRETDRKHLEWARIYSK